MPDLWHEAAVVSRDVYGGCAFTGKRYTDVFAFFSNRLGCLGSLGVSIIGSIVLLVLMRGCSGGVGW